MQQFFQCNVLDEASYLHCLLRSQEQSQEIVNRLQSSQNSEHYFVQTEKLKSLLSHSPLIIINSILAATL